MKVKSRPVVAGVVAVMTLAACAGWTVWKDPFVGEWKVEASPEGGAGRGFKDVLTFKGMKMTARDLSAKGWPVAEYEDDIRQGGIAQFTCTLKHASEGEMKWQGQVAASEIRGTIVWTRQGRDERRYSFTGTKN
jgi:hypothetical protein